tara:strand:- start:400 stop:576 length:177 start_codon:yes stop_codon:yes gene_type:complete
MKIEKEKKELDYVIEKFKLEPNFYQVGSRYIKRINQKIKNTNPFHSLLKTEHSLKAKN